MKAARDAHFSRIPPEPAGPTPEAPPAWEALDDEHWVPYRVRGSWRGGVLG
jgi:hypothetical protein